MLQEVWVATPEMRWVVRSGERVLQQRCTCNTLVLMPEEANLPEGIECESKLEWRDVPVATPADGIYGFSEVVRDGEIERTVQVDFDVQAFAACLIEAFKEVGPGSRIAYIQGPKPDGSTTIDGIFNMPVVVKLALLRMKASS
jgi:hypothetical protein